MEARGGKEDNMRIDKMSRIVRVIFFLCPNNFGLHSETYVRYVLIIDEHGNTLWIDDPTYDTLQDLLRQAEMADAGKKSTGVYSECPWCQAHRLSLGGETS